MYINLRKLTDTLKFASLFFYNQKREHKIVLYMTTKIANSTNEDSRYSAKSFLS